MSDIYPINFTWKEIDVCEDGGEIKRLRVMLPKPGAATKQASRQYTLDEEYTLEPVDERSEAQHRACFAELHQYWLNLPEKIQARWMNEVHFRKWLLIETGWYDEDEIWCASEKHAHEAAITVQRREPYARFLVKDKRLIIRRAKSQKRIAMRKKKQFQDSMRAILDLAAAFVGVSPPQMQKHARAL